MRELPIDASRVELVASGKVAEKPEYVRLSDGSSKRSGNQAVSESGVPLWIVDCFSDDDDEDRAEVVSVTVAAGDKPQVSKFRPVQFEGLTARAFSDRSSGRPRFSFSAAGIAAGAAAGKPKAVPSSDEGAA